MRRENFGDSRTFKADVGLLIFARIFRTSWPKMFLEGVEHNGERGGAMLTANELVVTSGGSYVCANFCENRSRNATVRVRTEGYTDTVTD